MQAFILAAGLGTRLKPFTDFHPKPMAVVQGKPLLQHNIEKLKRAGYSKLIINLHSMPEQIIEFLKLHDNFGLDITYRIEQDLLETGGGLRNIEDLIDRSKPITILNADILSNINLAKMYTAYQESDCIALLAVQNRESNRKLLFDENHHLIGWKSIQPSSYKPDSMNKESQYTEFAFSGIQIMDVKLLNDSQLRGKFSLIDLYLEQCSNHVIKAYLHDNDYLLDIGTPEKLQNAQQVAL